MMNTECPDLEQVSAGKHTCQDLKSTMTLPCPQDSIPPVPLALTFFLSPLLPCSLSLGRAESGTATSSLFGAESQQSLILGTLAGCEPSH